MMRKNILFLVLGVDALFLVLQIFQLSISANEASILYGDVSFLQLLVQVSISLFGHNDFAIRFPMILLHLLSVILLYKISKEYIYSQRNQVWLITIFIMLPGVLSSAIVINSAGILIFGLLFFIYIYKNFHVFSSYFLLTLYLFIDPSFVYMYISFILYSFYKKDILLTIVSSLLFIVSVYMYGFEAHGLPKGHFLDFIGVYSAIFTPIIFLYIFYVLYKRYFTKQIDVLWFLATTAFLISLILSFRQRVSVEHFAPYLILALPLVGQNFIHSYRVRLKNFRHRYRIIFSIALGFLIFNYALVLFSKTLYLVMEKPQNNFIYKMDIAKELANSLQKRGINCVQTDKDMMLRLRFYGIEKCQKYELRSVNTDEKDGQNVTISYANKIIYRANVTKINIK